MVFEVIVGLTIGVLFGFVQMILLNKVVKLITSENGGNNIYIILIIAQFLGFIAILVVIGLYSFVSTLVAGVAMAITALIVWVLRYKK